MAGVRLVRKNDPKANSGPTPEEIDRWAADAKHAKHSERPRAGHGEHAGHTELHADERWLVSYADMMTLLFGLFVLLFAMSKPEDYEKVQKSMRETFAEDAPKPPPMVPLADLEKAREELALLKEEREREKADLQTAQQKVASLESELMRERESKLEVEQSARKGEDLARESELLTENVRRLEAELEAAKRVSQEAEARLAALPDPGLKDTALQNLEKANQEKDLELAKLKAELAKQAREIDRSRKPASTEKTVSAREFDAVKQSESELKMDLAKQLQDLNAEKKTVADLREQLRQATGEQNMGFMAVVVSWPTQDHDIDLVVTDPKGREFSFKKRKIAGSAGQFSLDTRRGPGTELWQSAEIIPGTYKVTYIFYNKVNNPEPAVVRGTIFTPKGSFTMPEQKMTIDSNNRVVLTFKATDKGVVTLP